MIACDRTAIRAAESPHYNAMTKRLGAAFRERNELPDGYRFKLDDKVISLPEAAEWIGMERRCCPFLSFRLSASGSASD